MVPFYGQGMNAGLEDVRILFSVLDKHARTETNATGESPTPPGEARALQRRFALAEYTAIRTPDAHAINELALHNYIEMRSSVLSPMYRARKFLEEKISLYFPTLGWQTKYSRVSFSNERYSEVIAKSERQGKALVRGVVGFVTLPLAGALAWFLLGQRRGFGQSLKGLLDIPTQRLR